MISNKGYGEEFITLYSESENVGKPVVISANDTCAKADDGDNFTGILINARNGLGSVQIRGYVELPYSGTSPILGETVLAADGNGGVKSAASGKAVTVLKVDTTCNTVGFII